MKREGIKSVIFFVLGVGMVSLMLVAPGTANAQGKPFPTPVGPPSAQTPVGPIVPPGPPETPVGPIVPPGPPETPVGRPALIPPVCDVILDCE